MSTTTSLLTLQRSLRSAERRLQGSNSHSSRANNTPASNDDDPPPPPPPPRPCPPSPARLRELASDRSSFFVEMARRKELEEKAASGRAGERGKFLQELRHASERLYSEAMQRQKRLERLRAEDSEKENELQPFAPRVNPRRGKQCSTAAELPIYERAEALRVAREEALRRQQLEEEIRERQIRQERQGSARFTNRIVEQTEMLVRKRELERERALKLQQPKGAPTINPRSRQLAAKVYGNVPFVERTAHVQRQREEHRERLAQEHEQHQEQACRGGAGRGGRAISLEQVNRFVERVHDGEMRAKLAREERERAYYEQFDFAPSINPASRAIAPQGSGGIENLHQNLSGEMRKLQLRHCVDAERMKDCTFQPRIHSTAAGTASTPTASRDMHRAERLRRAQWDREMREVAECTFHPRINRRPPPPEKEEDVCAQEQVSGMDRFLERRRLAEDLRAEQAEREDRVFMRTLPPFRADARRARSSSPFRR